MKTKNLSVISIIIIASIFLALFIPLNIFRSTLFDNAYYDKQYVINNIYEIYDSNELAGFTEGLLNYFQNKEIFYNHTFFSEQDILHLKDVKDLIKKTLWSFYLTLAVTVLAIFGLYSVDKINFKRNVSNVLFGAGGILTILFTLTILFRK